MSEIPSMKRTKVNRNCQLQNVWVWDKSVSDLVRNMVSGRSLNVCAGLSDIGDIKVDLEPQQPSVVKMDMNSLEFYDNSFDTVISDPPWKIGYFKRMRPFFECVRVCKVGGSIIYNCTWRPTSKYVKLEKSIVRTDNNWANVSVIWLFRKIADIPKHLNTPSTSTREAKSLYTRKHYTSNMADEAQPTVTEEIVSTETQTPTEAPKKKRGNGSFGSYRVDFNLSKIVGVPEGTIVKSQELVKGLWSYIKSKELYVKPQPKTEAPTEAPKVEETTPIVA